MRFKITQRILADSNQLTWVVWDTEDLKIIADGSYVGCSAICRELNDAIPSSRLTQAQIDGDGKQRSRFFAMLSQVRAMVIPSTQVVK